MQINERHQPLSIFSLDKDQTILNDCEQLALYLHAKKPWDKFNEPVFIALFAWMNTCRLAWAHLSTQSNELESYKNRKLVYNSLIAALTANPKDINMIKPVILALSYGKDDALDKYKEKLNGYLAGLLKEKAGVRNYILGANHYSTLFNKSIKPMMRLFDKVERQLPVAMANKLYKVEHQLANTIAWAQFSGFGTISYHKKIKLEDAKVADSKPIKPKAKETKPSKPKAKKAKAG